MLMPIPNWQDKELYCYWCGTNLSVKYIATYRTNRGEVSVCACNCCAPMFIADKKESEGADDDCN